MIKYFFILFTIIIPLIFAQDCIKCKQGACTLQGCTACEDGFMLNSINQCGLFTPVEGCNRYDAYNGNCISCQEKRTLIGSRCLPKPQNCLTTDRNRECLECMKGFLLVRGNCYSQDIRNCSLGSLPSQNNLVSFCQPIRTQNCKSTNQIKICTQCQMGFTLTNGRCLKFSSVSTPCPKNQCKCSPGFFPYNQRCLQLDIYKCTLIRSDGTYCSACERGFVAIQGICMKPVKQDDINCNVIAPRSDYCTGCNYDFFLNEEAFCAKDFNFTDCVTSNKFYKQRNGKCVYIDSKCDAINFTGFSYNCIRCIEGFEINQNGICQRIVCIGYSSKGICNAVFTGYQIINNLVVKLPANCQSLVSGTTDQCASCSIFTKNISGRCVYEDKNCVEYNLNGFCIKCINEKEQDGYILIQRFCFEKATNCLKRDQNDQSRCLQCRFNYHLDGDRRCYINITGCDIYQKQSDCKQCSANFLLFEKRCLSVNTSCLDLNSRVCRRCQQGLLPFLNNCVYFHPFCLEYGADDGVCKRAVGGWSTGSGMNEDQKFYYREFIKRGEIVRSRTSTINLQGLVANIGAGQYSKSGGAIIQALPYANILHQKVNSVNMFGQITNCKQGFTKLGNLCLSRVVQGCELYHPNQNCLRCAPGFTLSANFTCTIGLVCNQASQNGRCLSCANGFINIGSGQCFKIQSRVVIDNLLKDSFTYFRYQLDGGLYVAWPRSPNCRDQFEPYKCTACSQKYQLVNGQCRIIIPNCNNYNQNSMSPGICQGCQNGFGLWFGQCIRLNCIQNVNGICQSCPANLYYYFGICLVNPLPNCRRLENNICALCSPRFYLNSQNLCAQQVLNCLTTNRDTGRCLQCKFSYTLYKDFCVRQIKYCQDYDLNTNRCIRCLQNSVNRTQLLSNGECALLQGQCKRVNQATRQCNQCNDGYTNITQNNNYLCVMPRQNCKIYDIRGRCTECNERYVLQSNQCRTYILFCIIYTDFRNTTCKKCQQGTLLTDGCCKIPDKNCFTYDRCLCKNCISRFFINQKGICQSNPPGCEIYDFPNKKCLGCQPSFFKINDICLPQIDVRNGCADGRNQTVGNSVTFICLSCFNGFILNATDRLCYGFNCASRSVQNRKCLSCPTFYKLFTPNNFRPQQTYCIPQFCQDYVPGESSCRGSTIIQQSYSINIKTTLIILTYCVQLDYKNKKCSKCTDLRYPNPSTPYGLCYPLNCLSPNQFNCQTCKFGYKVNFQPPGTCISSNCAKIIPLTGRCQICENQFTLNPVQGTCENRGCCETFDQSKNVCIFAKKYYTIQNGVCIPRNCQKVDNQNNTRCIQCYNGFTPVGDGSCRPKFCKIQSFNGQKCSMCNRGFINSIVVGTLRQICVPNQCAIVSKDGSYCEKCNQGFVLDPNFRLCISDFCKQIDQERFICKECLDDYILQNQRCVANCLIGTAKTCKCCNFGFALDKKTSLCRPNLNFCQKKTTADICQKCMDGYIISSGGQCVGKTPFCQVPGSLGCTKCIPGYQLINNCYCQAKYCMNLYQNGTCAQCIQRFQLTPDLLCRPRDCKQFSVQNWGCNFCFTRFTLSNGACISNNCQVWQNNIKTMCKKCGSVQYNSRIRFMKFGQIMPLELVNGGCYTKYCQKDPRNARCDECKIGFTLTYDQICECQVFDQNGDCKCPQNYIFDKSLEDCVPNKDVCIKRQISTGKCFQCPINYQILDEQCIPLYCKKAIMMFPHYYQCSQCYPNFSLRKGFCQNDICIKYEKKSPNLLSQCIQCLIGWKPYSSYCVPSRCQPQSYFIKNNSCSKCSFGYEPRNGICVMINCRIPKAPDSCEECDYGFEFSNNLCLARNCSEFQTNSSDCKSCIEGFRLFQKKCLANFCLVYNKSLICQQCFKNFFFNPLTFRCSRPNCVIDGEKECIKCSKGFKKDLSSNNCVAVNCRKYFQNYSCQTCLPDYYRQNGTCIDVLCQLQKLGDQFSCSQCQPGYNFNKNRTCYPDGADFCPPGRYYNNITCVAIPTPGCRMFLRNKCVWCEEFYFLQNGFCYPTQLCSKFSYYFGCYQCESQAILDSRKCRRAQIDPNCIKYENKKCSKCIQGYQLLVSVKCVKLIPNCRVMQQVNICKECQAGFSGQRCENSIDPNCISFNSLGQCRECVKGFYINEQGRCQKLPLYCLNATADGKCISCQPGKDLQEGVCYPNIPFCMKYLIVNNMLKCITCLDGFVLADNSCRCSPGTQLILPNRCAQLPQNCVRMDQITFKCLQCAPKYVLNQDKNNICQLESIKPLFCRIFNTTTGICNQCDPGYFLTPNSRLCVFILYCVSYANSGLCVQCQSGYLPAINGGSCIAYIPDPIPIIPTCFSQKGNQCQRCKHRYFLDSQMCTAYIPYCINIDLLGRCISCCFGSVLINGVCRKDEMIRYCSKQVGNTCQQCQPSYYYCQFCDACLPASPNCNQYNSLGECVKCIDNFILINGVCISPPVGEVWGTSGTCRSDYYLKDGNCYRNEKSLRLLSQVRSLQSMNGVGPLLLSSSPSSASPSPPSQSSFSLSSSEAVVIKSNDLLIIFGILMTSSSGVGQNANFILYYRSKIYDPLVCWNSCIPTKIDREKYIKQLNQPIIAMQLQVYILNQSRRSISIDFRIL